MLGRRWNNSKKRWIVGFLAVVMAMVGNIYMPIMAQASDENVDGIIYSDTYNIRDYWSQDSKTAPTMDNYVFGGWYKKSDSNYEPLTESEVATVSSAYAKFVPESVLSVKCQITAGTNEETEYTDWRIVTTVDSLKYKEVGFNVTVGKTTQSYLSDTVYTSVKGYTYTNADENVQYYTPKVFSEQSNYFMTYSLTAIPKAAFVTDITVVPQWETLDGTIVTGVKKEFIIGSAFSEVLIGSNLYGTFEAAVAAANKSAEDVTIKLLNDVVFNQVSINNTAGKNITIDGNGFSLITEGTNHTIEVNQTAGYITLKNVIVEHGSTGFFIRSRTAKAGDEYDQNITLKLIGVTVTTTSDVSGVYRYGIIDLADTGMTNLYLSGTNITMASSYNSSYDRGVIRTSDVADENTVYNIVLTDSNIDASQAEGAKGIRIFNGGTDSSGVTANVTLANNSSIKTKNHFGISTTDQCTVTVIKDSSVTFSSGDSYYDKTPIRGGIIVNSVDAIVAQIGGTAYETINKAITRANSESENVIIEILRDISFGQVAVNNTSGKNITIDGNDYALTTTGTSHTVELNQTSGVISLQNMTVKHGSTGFFIRTRTSASGDAYDQNITLNLTDVTIKTTNDVSGAYQYGIIDLADTGTTNLNLVRTDITMISSYNNGYDRGVLRIGDAADADTVYNITMTDSKIDAKQAESAKGIRIFNGLSGAKHSVYITLKNSTIMTKNHYPISSYVNKVVEVTKDSKTVLRRTDGNSLLHTDSVTIKNAE